MRQEINISCFDQAFTHFLPVSRSPQIKDPKKMVCRTSGQVIWWTNMYSYMAEESSEVLHPSLFGCLAFDTLKFTSKMASKLFASKIIEPKRGRGDL